MTRVAGYVRVSTDEQAERGHSIDEQERLICEAHPGAVMFRDPGLSGATDDRPGLQAMLSRLDEFDVIVVWAMDRLARDVELFARLTKQLTASNVRIESLTAHVDLTTPEGKAMAGVSAVFGQFERERIAERARAAVQARKRKGAYNGGPAPDGWMDVDPEDRRLLPKQPRPEGSRRVHDPDRAPLIQHMFELADRGVPDGPLARQLNEEGHRTRGGQPWTRRAVQNNVTNPWHAGRVALRRDKPDQEVFQGEHEPMVDPAVFDRIQSRRAKRDLGAGQHVQGRPAHRHLLAKLVRHGKCGAPMFCETSAYRRKSDGGRKRQYVCRGYKNSDGTCDFKVDAELVDTAVLEALPRLMPDFNEWIQQIEDRHAAERDRLQKARDQAVAERDAQQQKLARVEDNYLVLPTDEQEKLREALDRARTQTERAEVRAQATEDALASIPDDVPHDRLLDFASKLRAVINGSLDGDHTVGELNRALQQIFASFTICKELPEGSQQVEVEDALSPDSLYVFPNLRSEVAWNLVTEWAKNPGAEEPAPPMEWIEALAKSADTQA